MSSKAIGIDVAIGQKLGLARRLAILFFVLLAVGVVAIWVASRIWNINVVMAAVAWLVCVVSAQLAHIAGEYPRGEDNFIVRLAMSMFARTCLPFLLVILAKGVGGILFSPALVLFVVLFYLVGLIADMTLHLMRFRVAS